VSAVLVTNVSTGALYAAGTDYALDTVNGIIALSPTGTITSGASVNVGYTYAESVTAISSGGIAPTAPTN
jgi:hypothetical protein